nr:hypothetical protein [Tanacetum cinerariifolium]
LLEEPASSSGTLSSLQHLSRDISFGDQIFSDKPSEADKNVDAEVESMVNVPIQQAVSSISLMKSPIIDLSSRPEEPESGKCQPLPEVPEKGKAKVTKKQVAHDLLSLQKPKKKSPADHYIFQRHISEPTGSSLHDESPYAVLGQSDSEEESEKVVLGATEGGQDEGQTGSDTGTQDEGQAGSNPDTTSEGQAGPDPGNAGAEVQSIPSPLVHAGSDREHVDLDVADVSP